MLVPAQCHRQVWLRHILKKLTCACSIHNGLLLCVQFRWYLCVCVWFYLRHFSGGKKSNELEVEVFLARTRILCVSRRYYYTDPRVFPPKKSHVKLFSPPDIYVDSIRASMSSEYYHFAGLCDLKMLWAAIVVCSCHFDEKSHDANNSRNVEVEVTYFVHIFSPLSFFHM